MLPRYLYSFGAWQHARLNWVKGTSDDHVAPGGASIRGVNDGLSYGLCAFIHRSADGSGNVTDRIFNCGGTMIFPVWGDDDLVDVQVLAVKMMYVPQGAFVVGGASGTEIGNFYSFPTSTNSYSFNSEAAIPVGRTFGNLYYSTTSGSPGDQSGPVPASYPKDYNAFYCMKYEVSQDQWISFFNTLTDAQKLKRNITDVIHKNSDEEMNRNSVAWSGTGKASTNTANRPVNIINWKDSNAYLNWAFSTNNVAHLN